MEPPYLSIVAPAHNEAQNLAPLLERLQNVLDPLDLEWELVVVDDGSRDETFATLRALAETEARLRGLRLSRNFGHQVALTAGLAHARGEVVLTLDSDLQHPPELIPEMLRLHQQGYDVVNTLRTYPKGTGWFKRAASGLFYKVINRLSDIPITPGAADFRLMSRQVVDALLQLPERDRFTRGLVAWVGFRQIGLPYVAAPRHAGRSSYTLMRNLRFALDGLTSFSARPLRLPFFIGMLFNLGAVAYTIYALVALVRGETVPGWASLLIVTLLAGGLNLVFIALIGEYIARIYREAKGRPLYLVAEDTANPPKKRVNGG